MAKTDEYRETLRRLDDWEPFLLEHSGLPGPRANLELVSAVADEADEDALRRWAALDPNQAPTGSAEEFLPVCGVVGLGRLVAEGDRSLLEELRRLAEDPRWRIREAVAIALQRVGDADFAALHEEMERWAAGSPLERRAAVAALCEPRLLRPPTHAAGPPRAPRACDRRARPLREPASRRLPHAAKDARLRLERGRRRLPRRRQAALRATCRQRRSGRSLDRPREPEEEAARANGRRLGRAPAQGVVSRRTARCSGRSRAGRSSTSWRSTCGPATSSTRCTRSRLASPMRQRLRSPSSSTARSSHWWSRLRKSLNAASCSASRSPLLSASTDSVTASARSASADTFAGR